MPSRRTAQLIVALAAVHLFRIDRRTGDAIAVAEPFQEITIAATGAAEGRIFGPLRLAAHRAFLGFVGAIRHTRPTWEAQDRLARRRCRQAVATGVRSSRRFAAAT